MRQDEPACSLHLLRACHTIQCLRKHRHLLICQIARKHAHCSVHQISSYS